jgi:DNA helicase-2/ATP-dependent DNA helicase PcrA
MTYTQRNGKNIVALANKVAEPLRTVHTGVGLLQAVAEPRFGDGSIRAAVAADLSAEMDWLATTIKTEIAAGLAPEDVAVILRRNADVMEVHRQLTSRGLRCQVRSKWTLLEVPEVAEVVAYLRVIADPTANADWIRILTGPRVRIGDRDLKLIADLAAELTHGMELRNHSASNLQQALDAATAETDDITLVAYGDAISEIAEHGYSKLSPEAVERIRELEHEISYYRTLAMDGVAELVHKILRTTGLNVEAAATNDRLSRGMASNLRALLQVINGFNVLGTSGTLFDFLDWLDAGERFDTAAELPLVVHKGAIQIMTIHASKGLEYPLVALPRMFLDGFPSKIRPDYWHSNKKAIPYALRDERIDLDVQRFPIANNTLATKDLEQFKTAVQEMEMLDERRMAYVAITRAKAKLLVSTSWLQPAETKVRDMSPFLAEILDELQNNELGFALEINAPKPDDVEVEFSPITAAWPRAIEDPEHLATLELAAKVLDNRIEPTSTPLEEKDAYLVQQWDAAIAGIKKEAADLLAERVISLPDNLSVSAIQRLQKDEAEFLAQLIRPMPMAPSRAANIGTDFHSALERRFKAMAFKGYQTELEFADLQEFEESEPLAAGQVEKFLKRFDESEWADLVPAAFETAFTLELAGRSIFGRIDAVYAAPSDSGFDWYVIDWKTNSTASADPLQLALYRLAWAQVQKCPVERIRAGFYYVALGETHWPELPSLREIEDRLS